MLPSESWKSWAPQTNFVSRLNTWPARAPVNASPALLRVHTHDSGSAWVATPLLQETFTLNYSPVCAGAPKEKHVPAARRDSFRRLGRPGRSSLSARACSRSPRSSQQRAFVTQTSELSARGLWKNCSVFLGEVWSDFWAAFLQLGDVAIGVKWYSSLPDAEQYSDPATSYLS